VGGRRQSVSQGPWLPVSTPHTLTPAPPSLLHLPHSLHLPHIPPSLSFRCGDPGPAGQGGLAGGGAGLTGARSKREAHAHCHGRRPPLHVWRWAGWAPGAGMGRGVRFETRCCRQAGQAVTLHSTSFAASLSPVPALHPLSLGLQPTHTPGWVLQAPMGRQPWGMPGGWIWRT